MNKLSLDIETIHVESFVTDEASGIRGTVHGKSVENTYWHGTLCWPGCISDTEQDSCAGGDSCSCPGPGECGRQTSNSCTE
jgi:hypothetical protein